MLLIFISNEIDFGLNIFFAVEALLKIISYGFYFDEKTYLKDSWNMLDFFIVVSSILDMIFADLNLSFIKVNFIYSF